MKKQYLESGKIVTTHGVRGEVRVQPWCDTPGFLTQFACLYLDARGSQARVVERARVHKNIVIVKFEGVGFFVYIIASWRTQRACAEKPSISTARTLSWKKGSALCRI